MNLRELIEHANLSALGLLEPEEQQLYERALIAAPDAVRTHLIAEQERWASSGVLLGHEAPPPALRARVLEAVRIEMVRTQSLEDASQDVEGSLLPNPSLAFARQHRVSPWWRMAAMVGLSATAAMTGAFLYAYQGNSRVQASIDENQWQSALLSQFKGDFINGTLFSEAAKYQSFTSAGEAFPGKARLLLHPDWKVARLYCFSMPVEAGKVYRLVTLDASGKVSQEIRQFRGGVQPQVVEFDAQLAPTGTRFAIISIDAGKPSQSADAITTLIVTVV